MGAGCRKAWESGTHRVRCGLALPVWSAAAVGDAIYATRVGTVNAAHQQGGQTTSMDGSTVVEGIEEEKEERGVSCGPKAAAENEKNGHFYCNSQYSSRRLLRRSFISAFVPSVGRSSSLAPSFTPKVSAKRAESRQREQSKRADVVCREQTKRAVKESRQREHGDGTEFHTKHEHKNSRPRSQGETWDLFTWHPSCGRSL